MEVKAGLVTDAQVNTGSGGNGKFMKWDFNSPATWSAIFTVLAILILLYL